MWFPDPGPQSPLSGAAAFLIVVYCIAYAIGFGVGGGRAFKWIAGIAGGVFVLLFMMAAGEGQIGGAGLLFILAIPVLGWTVPFTIGGLTRKLIDGALSEWALPLKWTVIGLSLLSLPALAFHKILIDKYLPPDFEACAARGFTGTIGGRPVMIPMSFATEFDLSNYSLEHRHFRMSDRAHATRLCRGASEVGAISALRLQGYYFVKSEGEAWMKESCPGGRDRMAGAICSFAALPKRIGLRVEFVTYPLTDDSKDRQAVLQEWARQSTESPVIKQTGITLNGTLVLRGSGSEHWVASINGLKRPDGQPLLFECNKSVDRTDRIDHCWISIYDSNFAVRSIQLWGTESELVASLPRAYATIQQLTEAIYQVPPVD